MNTEELKAIWDGKPKGATHYVDVCKTYFNITGLRKVSYWSIESLKWKPSGLVHLPRSLSDIETIIKQADEIAELKKSEFLATDAAQDMCVDMEQAKRERDATQAQNAKLQQERDALKRPIELGDRITFTKANLEAHNLEQQAKGVINGYVAACKWALGSQYDEEVAKNRAATYGNNLRNQAKEQG